MSTRIIVALVALPLVIAPVWLGGVWVTLLALFVALIGANELYDLLEKSGHHPARGLGMVWVALFVLYNWPPALTFIPGVTQATLLMVGLIALLIYTLYQAEHPLDMWMATGMGAVYLGIMLGQALALRLLPEGFWWVVLGLLVTWGNDTVAYFVGTNFGRHKLWPRLSPKKSWEGTVSGWLGAALLGGLAAWLSPLNASFLFGAFLGASGGILALFGDLSISMFKRRAGVKDSSNFFPGHGGMLDRLDSPLFVLPFIYQAVIIWGG